MAGKSTSFDIARVAEALGQHWSRAGLGRAVVEGRKKAGLSESAMRVLLGGAGGGGKEDVSRGQDVCKENAKAVLGVVVASHRRKRVYRQV